MMLFIASQRTLLTDQTAYLPAPIITDFIENTKRKLYDVKLEHALEMLDLEWIKHDIGDHF